jgi:LysR family transcriptional regulator, glycine cleavage system transcriptional activator
MHNRRELPFSLDLLRGFEAAARHLSFTAAAEELFLTQSAISRQVQTLEEQLGVKLFERRTRALALTRAGESYYQQVAKALQQLRDATAHVRGAADPLVRVTTTVTFASLWLVPRLARFQSQFADIPVHVIADNVLQDLERDVADVAVRYTTEEKAGSGAVMLFDETVAPVCSPSLVGGRKRVQKPEELLVLPLLHYDATQFSTPWLSWEVWLEAMGLEHPKGASSLSFSHYDQLIQAAVAGQGVALGRFPLMNELLRGGQLVMPLRSPPAAITQGRGYWLVVPSRAAVRPQVQTFVEWLRFEASEALQARQTKRQEKR